MFPVKAMRDRKSKKFGNPVCIQYCYCPVQRTVLSTEVNIPVRYWHRKQCRVTPKLPHKFGEAEIINGQIKTMLRVVEALVGMVVRKKINPLEFVKSTFHPNPNLGLLNMKDLPVKKKVQKTKEETANLNVCYQIAQYLASKIKKTCFYIW